jgi:hypothetical protein
MYLLISFNIFIAFLKKVSRQVLTTPYTSFIFITIKTRAMQSVAYPLIYAFDPVTLTFENQ